MSYWEYLHECLFVCASFFRYNASYINTSVISIEINQAEIMVKLTQIFVLFLIFGTVKVQSQEPRKRYRKFFPMQSRRQASILSNIFFVLSAAAVERYQVYQMEHLMHLVYLPRRIFVQLDHLDEPKLPKPSKKRKHVGEHRASEFFFRPM